MEKLFALEIYDHPANEPVAFYEREVGFGGFAVGDLVTLPDIEAANSKKVLMVKRVEHVFWEAGPGLRQKTMLFCQWVNNTQDLR